MQQVYREYAIILNSILTTVLNKEGRNLIIDDELALLYRLLILYFTSNNEFENSYLQGTNYKIKYSLNKGILLSGVPGRSKSFMFEKIIPIFLKKISSPKSYKILSSFEIAKNYKENGYSGESIYQRSYSDKRPMFYDIYIDEIGAEQKTVKNWGTDYNPLETFLDLRHRVFKQTGCVVHGSTNLNPEDFKAKYSERIYSRMFEMFNIIVLKGTDLRIELL